MKARTSRLLPVLLLLFGALPAWGKAAAPDPAAAACVRQLKVIGRALLAYQRDHHQQLPDHLSDLWPRYVRESGWFHCPADRFPSSPGHEPAAREAVPAPRIRPWVVLPRSKL